uniref:Integrase catalytic domain-containing protein n=1 Tax=Onchocerca volvulus TaxID=6282 RepID=A0A8R1TL54_ONCVO
MGKNGTASKRWVALFTCPVTRAIHMEVMKNMSAEAFMQTFRRFVCRRRRPDFMSSDNAKNFVLASKLIQENSNQDEKPLKWQFITPEAPWQGSVYERMVGVVKRTLQRAVKKNLLEEGEFTTLINEIEFLVNERLLVDYERDGEQVLCPGDFLWPDYNMRRIHWNMRTICMRMTNRTYLFSKI